MQPKIISAIVATGVHHGFAIAREPQEPESRTLEIHQLCSLPTLSIEQREHFLVLAGMLKRGKRPQFAIRRTVEDSGNRQIRACLSSSALNQHTRPLLSAV